MCLKDLRDEFLYDCECRHLVKVACAVQAADEVSYPPECLFKGIPQSPQEPVSQQEREAFDG